MIIVRRSTLVEVVNQNGEIVAKAVRADTNSSWIVGRVIEGRISPVAEVHSHVPEVLGRKLVIAMLKEFVTTDDED